MGRVSSALAGCRPHQCLAYRIYFVDEVKGLSGLSGLPHEAHLLLAGGSDEVCQGSRFWEYHRFWGSVAVSVPFARDFHH